MLWCHIAPCTSLSQKSPNAMDVNSTYSPFWCHFAWQCVDEIGLSPGDIIIICCVIYNTSSNMKFAWKAHVVHILSKLIGQALGRNPLITKPAMLLTFTTLSLPPQSVVTDAQSSNRWYLCINILCLLDKVVFEVLSIVQSPLAYGHQRTMFHTLPTPLLWPILFNIDTTFIYDLLLGFASCWSSAVVIIDSQHVQISNRETFEGVMQDISWTYGIRWGGILKVMGKCWHLCFSYHGQNTETRVLQLVVSEEDKRTCLKKTN
jgi:hypothetical protein